MENEPETVESQPTLSDKLQAAQAEEKRLWTEMELFEAEIKPMTAKLESLRSRWYDAKKRADAFGLLVKEAQ